VLQVEEITSTEGTKWFEMLRKQNNIAIKNYVTLTPAGHLILEFWIWTYALYAFSITLYLLIFVIFV
jgi:hypothetical protein